MLFFSLAPPFDVCTAHQLHMNEMNKNPSLSNFYRRLKISTLKKRPSQRARKRGKKRISRYLRSSSLKMKRNVTKCLSLCECESRGNAVVAHGWHLLFFSCSCVPSKPCRGLMKTKLKLKSWFKFFFFRFFLVWIFFSSFPLSFIFFGVSVVSAICTRAGYTLKRPNAKTLPER